MLFCFHIWPLWIIPTTWWDNRESSPWKWENESTQRTAACSRPIDSKKLIRESSCLPLFYTHCILQHPGRLLFISKAVYLRMLYIWHIVEDDWFSKTTLFFPFISAFCYPGLGTDTLDTYVDRALWTRIKFRLVKGNSSSWERAGCLYF